VNALPFLLAALPCLASSALADSPIEPFVADYVVLRDGKELGRTTIELRSNADATWTLRTTTRGTAGLAKLAGLDVVEESQVRWRDGNPETLVYNFHQNAAFKSRRRHASFDWPASEVRMQDGDSDARYALVAGTVDRHAVTLALASDLMRGETRFDYKVAAKEGIEDIRYTDCGRAEVTVPAGSYFTNCLERVRARRTSTSWFAESIGWLPVQIEQVESKGERITLRLAALRQE